MLPLHQLPGEPPLTLLQATLERVKGLVPPERTWIVTNRSQAEQIAESLPHFDKTHIWAEPVSRNTAASIGWAAVKLRHIDPEAWMVVVPADHIIKPTSAFCETIQSAYNIFRYCPQTLITIGVKPTYPATSYGYIQRCLPSEKQLVMGGGPVEGGFFTNFFKKETGYNKLVRKYPPYPVLRFCEKPNRETAEQFCESGDFYWNTGIFLWEAQTILYTLRRFDQSTGNMGSLLANIAKALGTPEEERVTEEAFQQMMSISIDYAVLERVSDMIAVFEAPFEWNDVGTWTALDRLHADQKDEQGNIAVDSQLLAIDSTGCTVRCDDPNHLIALIGLHDVVVIQTSDATLIARKDEEESVRRVVEELKKRHDGQWS
jgi:mannose-1-phosphate guanylyltransferase